MHPPLISAVTVGDLYNLHCDQIRGTGWRGGMTCELGAWGMTYARFAAAAFAGWCADLSVANEEGDENRRMGGEGGKSWLVLGARALGFFVAERRTRTGWGMVGLTVRPVLVPLDRGAAALDLDVELEVAHSEGRTT